MNNKAYIAIIVILALICGWLGYTVFTKDKTIDEKETVIEDGALERERLKVDLMQMQMSYDTLFTDNSALTAEMADQKAQIDDLLKKVSDSNWSVSKLKKEARTLRDIMKGYVVTIDSLNTANQQLMADNENMRTQVENVTGEIDMLREKQDNMENLISSGKSLQATSVSVDGIRLRNSGKQVETGRASKTELIKTCFSVLRNTIADTGNKTLFARIIAPDGKILPAKNGAVTGNFEGAQENYSVKREIDYQGAELAVCIFYEFQSEAIKGDYKVMLYENERLMGTGNLTLN